MAALSEVEAVGASGKTAKNWSKMKPSRACYATQTEPTETWTADSDLGTVTLEGWGQVVRWDYDEGGASEPYFEDGVKAYLGTGKDRIEITSAVQRWIEEEKRNFFA